MDHPIKARRRPTEVDCIQYTGMNTESIQHFVGPANFKESGAGPKFFVAKFDGSDHWHLLSVGDWVMAEADGSGFYPCDLTSFNKLYEQVH